ncbi:EVE domain-containing protein [Bacillus cereus group sp. Bce018]|uniref:EVE domain-containing protein n=1 Tax=Bacillus cereus group sp. Bce018 TaxID=3445248 RepID=UPI003307F1C8|nr:EVE domain-containing protein [Bacillus anthracis]
MNTWIFQGNPKHFNVDDYVLENETIWWSIRQEHLAKQIKINDEVFIWRSDGGQKGTGGIIARAKVDGLPEYYKNDEESAAYWYEDVSDKSYLAIKLKVLEVDVKLGISRIELLGHSKLSDLLILRLKQNTNYFVEEKHKSHLKKMWYNRYPVNAANVSTRFPLVKSLDQVKENMKQFETDITEVEELEKELKSFQQWYYLHNEGLLAPSKFIGYQEMKGHIYVDKPAIAGLDGRVTEKELRKLGFVTTNNELLKQFVHQKLNGRTRKDFSVNILESEREQIEVSFAQIAIENGKNTGGEYILPPLDSNGRVREYNYYSDELKGQVIYEHLINNENHRWMDINILGRKGNTNGRDSANILYYLGLRANYRGLFSGKSLGEVIEIFKSEGEEYSDIVRLLQGRERSIQLYENVISDIESQEIEEGGRIEGTKRSYYVNKYERNIKNRKKAIEIHGLNCYACGFNFEEIYGGRGKDFIEIHHIKPLSTLEEAIVIDPETDLVPLCANCHRMVHRRKDEVLTIEQLKALIKNVIEENM